jgi:hypothetical protein
MDFEKEKKRKKNKFGEELVQVSAWVDKTIVTKIQQEGLTMSHVIKLGYKAYNDNPQLINRIRTNEEQLEVLKETMHKFTRKMYDLEEQIRK